ncbi:hypothetical protein FGO68_gene7770 [Halteria grandinella]|uniref:Uncharacterized protein n=1 Tax=Halteria grandinella TaxID=5974 RepID=A0A8J8NBR7_HALGN|nr:hypothetical protein FGO68_gene7770 [Halteria grandinella]
MSKKQQQAKVSEAQLAEQHILNQSIRERLSIRVGFSRLFSILLPVLWVLTNVINAKGEELYQQRQAELVGIAKKEDDSVAREKRQAVIAEINKEATLFGLWLVNASFLFSWVFFSFVVVRFWPTNWNYCFTSVGASILSQYLPYQFVHPASYYYSDV